MGEGEDVVELEVVVISSTGSEHCSQVFPVGPEGIDIGAICHRMFSNGSPRKRYHCCEREFLRSHHLDQAMLREYRDAQGGKRPILRIENILG